jgi:hypothetical protein
MNKDQLYRHTVSILKQLRIPFLDPCDEDYLGDCLCGGGSNPTLQQVINTQRGSESLLDVNYYDNIHTTSEGYYAVASLGVINLAAANQLLLSSGQNTTVESNGQLSLTALQTSSYIAPSILIQASDSLSIDNTGGPISLTGTQLLFNGSPVGGSNQSLSIAGYNLSISGGNTVPLPQQSLSISGNNLSITDGNTIALPTNAQSLSLTGNTLAISGGNSVSLAAYVNTDAQTLALVGSVLSISNGNSVTLPSSTAQTLSISGSDLTISGGNTVTLPAGASQNLSLGTRTNTAQPVNISGGTGVSLPVATTSLAGLMSGTDKTKLDSLPVAVNLALGTRTSTEIPITNSYGTGFNIPIATTLLAGLLSATDKVKLDGLGNADLSLSNITGTTIQVNSSNGTDVTLPAVTTTTAGLMVAADKVKLNTLQAVYDVDTTGIDTNLTFSGNVDGFIYNDKPLKQKLLYSAALTAGQVVTASIPADALVIPANGVPWFWSVRGCENQAVISSLNPISDVLGTNVTVTITKINSGSPAIFEIENNAASTRYVFIILEYATV